jgi:hypothetical protein
MAHTHARYTRTLNKANKQTQMQLRPSLLLLLTPGFCAASRRVDSCFLHPASFSTHFHIYIYKIANALKKPYYLMVRMGACVKDPPGFFAPDHDAPLPFSLVPPPSPNHSRSLPFLFVSLHCVSVVVVFLLMWGVLFVFVVSADASDTSRDTTTTTTITATSFVTADSADCEFSLSIPLFCLLLFL